MNRERNRLSGASVAERAREARDLRPARPADNARPSAAQHLRVVRSRGHEGAEGFRPEGVPQARTQRSAQVVVFFSCHGGAGSTTLATTVGSLLSEAGYRTCVLDLDFQFGDVLSALSLKPRYPIADLLGDLEQMERERLYRSLPRFAECLYVLSQVGHVRSIPSCTPRRMNDVVRHIQGAFDYILVDGVRDFSDDALALLDHADEVLFISTQDALALRGLAFRLDLYRQMQFPRVRNVRLVLNRFRARRSLPPQLIAIHLGLNAPLLVRANAHDIERAQRQGTSMVQMAPHSGFTGDVRTLAEQVCGVSLTAGQRPAWQRWLPWRGS